MLSEAPHWCPKCGSYQHERWREEYQGTLDHRMEFILVTCTHCGYQFARRCTDSVEEPLASPDLPADRKFCRVPIPECLWPNWGELEAEWWRRGAQAALGTFFLQCER